MLKRKKIAKKEEELEKAVTVLQDFLDSIIRTKEASRELGEKKAKLEKIIEHKTKELNVGGTMREKKIRTTSRRDIIEVDLTSLG